MQTMTFYTVLVSQQLTAWPVNVICFVVQESIFISQGIQRFCTSIGVVECYVCINETILWKLWLSVPSPDAVHTTKWRHKFRPVARPWAQWLQQLPMRQQYTYITLSYNVIIYMGIMFALAYKAPWQHHMINTLNAELNPVRNFLALLGAHHILQVSRIRVNTVIT